MTEIILTSDQTQRLAAATDGVVIADAAGNVVASIPPRISEEEEAIIAESKRRLSSDQPVYPSSEVLERLRTRDQQ